MKKLLGLLAGASLIATSTTTVVACNTRTLGSEYSNISSLNSIWTNSLINNVPLNLILNGNYFGTDSDGGLSSKTKLEHQLSNLISFRLSNFEKWEEVFNSGDLSFSYKFEGIEVPSDEAEMNSFFDNLIAKHKGAARISGTFKITSGSNSTNDLEFNLTAQEAFSTKLNVDNKTIEVDTPLTKFVELASDTLWLDQSKVNKTEMTTAELQAIAYQSLLTQIKNSNYSVYVNQIYSQVSASNFVLNYQALNISNLISYLMNPFKNKDEKLTFVTGNEGKLEKIEGGSSTIKDFKLFGVNVTLRSLTKIKITDGVTPTPTPPENPGTPEEASNQ
ncbi:hypothetical protein SCLARK_00983 [Spiroplasma clarkii]|uniref:Lipoprotein n=1 Tax=Spiroplasma clarkii TaxID=2139 RepID=A0A1Y0L1H1_9MOLU|nr:lipoprotein [Spiroplasma clarkii]ARU91578.1 hypothetical protein SCLARK_00983 [Spiroplasma clarkii]ATX70978.1 hypothetical protein SCLAR_v1c06610 [Spiroplasma clarkii]